MTSEHPLAVPRQQSGPVFGCRQFPGPLSPSSAVDLAQGACAARSQAFAVPAGAGAAWNG